MQPEQSYANHRRYFPLFHFFVIPILTINWIVSIVVAWRNPSATSWWQVLVAFTILMLAFAARLMALAVQNRLIRLEETLRLERLLPDDLRPRIGELRTRHFIGLRFCSDEEVTHACRAVLAGEATTSDAIKRRVKNWRADYLRA